jgi:hypothetical protein
MAYKTIIGTMKTAGTLDISAGDIDLAAGSVDNADLAGSIANSKLANDSVTVTAGNGLSGGGEVDLGASVALALDLNELTAVQIASGDFLPLVDASDNSTKKESIDDIATLFAGDGLAASSAVLAVQVSGAVQVASDKVGIAAAFAGNGLAASGSSTHIAALSLDLNELSAAAVDVANDSFAMLDATDNSSKKESIADLMTAVAGNGLKAASGVLAMDLNELTEATLDRANDYVIFIDADDSNSTKKESFADLAAKLADGDGIEAASGKLSVKVDDSTVEIDTDTVRVKAAGVNVSHLNSAVAGNGLQGGAGSALALDLNELTAVQIASGDFLPLVDASDNSTKKESIDDIATLFAGDGLGASSAVLSVQVSGAMSVSSDKVGLKASIAGAGLAASGSSNHMEVLSLDLSEYSRVDIAAGDHFLVLDSDGATEQLERVDKFSDFLAGDGLEASSGVMAVKVDDSSIEINSDTVRVKASGVTNAMLANSAISVAGQSISLGGSATALTGLTDLDVGSAGNFTFFDTVGANTLTLGAATSTVKVAGDLEVGGTLNTVSTTELLVEDKTIQVARGAADSSAADGAGLKIDGSDKSITWSHSDQAFKVDADLYAAAGLSGRLHAITADTTLSQGHFLVKVSTSGGAVTVTLPSSMPTGKVFVIKDAGAASSNAITIATAGSETIDGAASIQIISNYGAANLMFDGSNYLVW